MKRLKYMIVSIVCLISGVLILFTSFHKDTDILRDSQVAINFASNEDREAYSTIKETPKELRQIDGLPESAQIPGDEDLAKLDETTLLQVYWKYINMLQILCKDVIRVGNLRDGGKEICVDPDYKPEAPCLVYSFGINHLFDFDRDVVERFGCDVHCFDPSMTNETKRISKHIWFYRWGLGGKNEINSKQWNVKTLDTIRKELGHSNLHIPVHFNFDFLHIQQPDLHWSCKYKHHLNTELGDKIKGHLYRPQITAFLMQLDKVAERTIDLLKIDIEGDEWNAIPQMISSGALDDVRQISMETHFSAEHANQNDFWGNLPPHKQLSSLRQLYDFGYRTFMRERNMWSHSMWYGIKGFITTVNEISMIKPKR